MIFQITVDTAVPVLIFIKICEWRGMVDDTLIYGYSAIITVFVLTKRCSPLLALQSSFKLVKAVDE